MGIFCNIKNIKEFMSAIVLIYLSD